MVNNFAIHLSQYYVKERINEIYQNKLSADL